MGRTFSLIENRNHFENVKLISSNSCEFPWNGSHWTTQNEASAQFPESSFPFIPIDSYSRYLVNCCCGNCHWPYPKLTIPIGCAWENDGHFSIWSKHHFKIVIRQAGRTHTSCRSAAVGVKGKGSMREWGVGGVLNLHPKSPVALRDTVHCKIHIFPLIGMTWAGDRWREAKRCATRVK